MARKLPRFTLYPFRWVMLTLYVLLVAGFLLLAVFSRDHESRAFGYFIATFTCLTQFLLVFATVKREAIRPVRKRRLVVPLIASAAMLVVLGFGAFIAAVELYDKPVSLLTGFLFVPLAGWIVWGVLFFLHTRPMGRFASVKRFTAFLFVGSLLELLATIPSHLIVIRRPGCLVGLGTMMGIAAGVYVALWSFGPFVVLLFLRPKKELEEKASPGVPDQPAGFQFSLLSLFLFTLFLATALSAFFAEETGVDTFWLALALGLVCAWRAIRRIRQWEREAPDLSDPHPPFSFRPSAGTVLFFALFALASAAYWLPMEDELRELFLWPAAALCLTGVLLAFREVRRWERGLRAELAALAPPVKTPGETPATPPAPLPSPASPEAGGTGGT
jgi:hypothetical protein